MGRCQGKLSHRFFSRCRKEQLLCNIQFRSLFGMFCRGTRPLPAKEVWKPVLCLWWCSLTCMKLLRLSSTCPLWSPALLLVPAHSLLLPKEPKSSPSSSLSFASPLNILMGRFWNQQKEGGSLQTLGG